MESLLDETVSGGDAPPPTEQPQNPSDEPNRSKSSPEIVLRRIDELKLDPRNARQHSGKQIKQLARSIRTFGYTVPALIDDEGNVLAGHARILACRQLGLSVIPAVVITGLSEK